MLGVIVRETETEGVDTYYPCCGDVNLSSCLGQYPSPHNAYHSFLERGLGLRLSWARLGPGGLGLGSLQKTNLSKFNVL